MWHTILLHMSSTIFFFLFFISNIIAFDFYWCTLFAFSQKQLRSLSINQFWHCWKCVRHASRQFLSSQRVSCSVRSRVICSRSIRLLCSLAAGGCACQLNQLNVRITCGNVDLLGMGIKKIMRIQIKTKKECWAIGCAKKILDWMENIKIIIIIYSFFVCVFGVVPELGLL